jgi:hypothetical protein
MSTKRNPKKALLGGLVMVIIFAVVLVGVFLPLFKGHNGLDYLDNLYNSISKDSAYYIPELTKAAQRFAGQPVKAELKLTSEAQAAQAALLLAAAGAQVQVQGSGLRLEGDLGRILAASLADANAMFHNDGPAMRKRYPGQNERAMLYAWWLSYKALEKDLNRQKAFAQAKFVQTVQAKGMEMAYNYYGIQPQSIGERWGVVLFSLLFYVIYTLWYGYGVMYLFEGSGFRMGH